MQKGCYLVAEYLDTIFLTCKWKKCLSFWGIESPRPPVNPKLVGILKEKKSSVILGMSAPLYLQDTPIIGKMFVCGKKKS